MRSSLCPTIHCTVLLAAITCLLGFVSVPLAPAQSVANSSTAQAGSTRSAAKNETIAAIFLSDIHFDPFHDPGKVKQLAAASVTQWKSILAAPPSPDQQEAFESLQSKCNARGVDTPFALLESSLKAVRERQPDAKFMVVSGDLMAHAFTCRYAAIFPGAPAGDYEAFAVKTVSFVAQRLRDTFPGIPVYLALGNNDSGCGDYQLDSASDWLARVGKIFAADLPEPEQQKAAKEFAAEGNYSVVMAEPMKDTRLIAIDDVFLSTRYKTCAGKNGSAGANEELDWLSRQLAQARQEHQRVWLLGHIPPGIDLHATAIKFRNICGGEAPVMFLSSPKLADLLVEYSDTVRLGIFGHTHMDELSLLGPEGADADKADGHRVAIKMVSSISPVDGNNPSFTIARVDPSTATLEDYTVFAASNQTGIDTIWSKEYDYAKAYHEADFTPAALAGLIGRFQADSSANTPESQSYLRSYFVGDLSSVLSPFWPQYVCSLGHYTAGGFAGCVCPAGK